MGPFVSDCLRHSGRALIWEDHLLLDFRPSFCFFATATCSDAAYLSPFSPPTFSFHPRPTFWVDGGCSYMSLSSAWETQSKSGTDLPRWADHPVSCPLNPSLVWTCFFSFCPRALKSICFFFKSTSTLTCSVWLSCFLKTVHYREQTEHFHCGYWNL